ncbi:N-glycosylase/DNA lyase-like [Liolophura sinensis]|uniref:N-glycosylase/DNA lyase-like n=1 Tax=Liolophura sinensis TaxID=3198878 RepID=UPI003158FE63
MWKSFVCPRSELKLSTTLACGQSFRWREKNPGEWIGVLAGRVWLLSQDDDQIYFKTFGNSIRQDKPLSNVGRKRQTKANLNTALSDKGVSSIPEDNVCTAAEKETLRDYFQLSVSLVELYNSWSKSDLNFHQTARNFDGIRMLRQDPVENLFSFICSSNNHISRISQMVERLCQTYGDKIIDVDGYSFHAFPSVKPLASDDVEQELRALGFGYRAKYINQTAKHIMQYHDENWLYSLRSLPYKETKTELMKLCGVGAKVADCVCLMSLDKAEAVPVDTHVWQIAARDYMPKLKQAKSLTDKLYGEIGDHFRGLWGDYAGWAHSVLFTADLKQFKEEKSSEKLTEKKCQGKRKVESDSFLTRKGKKKVK